MNGNGRDGLHVLETEKIIGCEFAVLNSIGHGFHETPYEKASVVDFQHHGTPYVQQARHSVRYREVKIGQYIPDLIVFKNIVVNTKTLEGIKEHKIGQMLDYLCVTGLQAGFISNFKQSELQVRRVSLKSTNPPAFLS